MYRPTSQYSSEASLNDRSYLKILEVEKEKNPNMSSPKKSPYSIEHDTQTDKVCFLLKSSQSFYADFLFFPFHWKMSRHIMT